MGVERHEEALNIYREIGIRLGEAHSLDQLGDCALDRFDSVQATVYWEQAATLLTSLGLSAQAFKVRSKITANAP